HQERLIAFLTRMIGRREAAEDVAQEAFVRALQGLSRFDPQYRFSTWLFTIARRVYWNQIEKMKPVVSSDLLSKVPPAWGLTNWASERAEDHAVQRSALQRALMELTPAQREIVVLFHQQDWPVGQIAQALGIPPGTVKSHLHRGRNRLREALHLHGWVYGAEGCGLERVGGPSGTQAKGAPIVEVPSVARHGARERGA
ncbi:MAG TPA: sigma-70 family RNA polymerase sigma factor, partial [Thermoanaerobaculia bacterium]|nr:sigma-70 family RNA polymerase sigma factor [Thermoanaerobaculia bacterium]